MLNTIIFVYFLYGTQSNSYEVLNAIDQEIAVTRKRPSKNCAIFPYIASGHERLCKMMFLLIVISTSRENVE